MPDLLDQLRGHERVAVLTSGGVDSAILLAELACGAALTGRVAPIYVRFGLVWEQDEEHALRRFLAALHGSRAEELIVLEAPMRGVYGEHWSATGQNVPDQSTPDEAVYLPGRNLMLLAPTAVWCHLQGIETIALGHLGGNPFADSTPEFFESYLAVLNRALGSQLRIVQPYRSLTKTEVLRRGHNFPLGLTWSCIHPVRGYHCGRCNKCAERQRAFAEAGVPDTTAYAERPDLSEPAAGERVG
jgi:7-cyano-7-deazaguanine synthase